jgi:PAS domain S-box-containing protein
MTNTIDRHAGLIAEALDRLDTIVVVLGPPEPPATLPTILAANFAFARRAGERKTGAALGGLSSYLLPETSRVALDALTRAVIDGARMSGEILLLGQGGPFWLGYSLTTVSVPGANARCVLIGKDITDQMRRSGEDRATQRLLASAFRSVDAAVAIVTAGDRIVTTSQRFALMCGRTSKELTGSSVTSILDAEVRQKIHAALAATAPDAPAALFRGGGLHPDGTPFAASFGLTVIEGRASERLAIVTVHQDASPAAPVAGSDAAKAAAPEAVSKIRLMGLDEVKSALGPRWASVADRAMILAEAAIRRRLGAQDVVSRTTDQAFLIWFQQGSAEENEHLIGRIAREVRIVLLTEFADAIISGVASATVALPPGSAGQQVPPAALAELDRRAAAPPDPALEAARTYLAWVEKELPVETEQMFGRSGQPLPAVWCSLPASVAARLTEASTTLKRETLGPFELDILRLRAALAVASQAATRNQPRACFVTVPCACLLSPRSRAVVLEVLSDAGATLGGRMTLLLGAPFSGIGAARLHELAGLLRGRVRGLGLAADAIRDLPIEAIKPPFAVVSFQPGALADETAEADLWQVMNAIQRTGAKVIARQIATPAQARMLLELGVNFVCGTAPAVAA